jgi:hypothetical protein
MAGMVVVCVRRNRRQVVSVGSVRRRRYASLVEDPAARGSCDAMAELERFPLDALVAPGLILRGQLFDQGGDGAVEGRAPGAVRVGPLSGHQAAVPPQDGGRGDEAVSAQLRGWVSDQPGEHGSVGSAQAGLGLGSAERGDLVAQDEQLDVFGRRCVRASSNRPRRPIEDQVGQA